jgi:hypothetical protein
MDRRVPNLSHRFILYLTNVMQEIIVYILILAAAILVGYKAYKAIRNITNPNPCGGCGKSCEGCPVAPRKK